MHIAPNHRNSRPAGYALVLVMVALVVLTILGVTGVTVAQLDVKVAQNLRHYRQVSYGAIAGTDHVRALFNDGGFEATDVFVSAWPFENHCITGWVGGTNSVASPIPLTANGLFLSTYEVNVCAVACGQPLSGNDIGSQVGVRSVILDVVATGHQIDTATGDTISDATSTIGGFIYAQTSSESVCNGS
jgi:hypothetical protein